MTPNAGDDDATAKACSCSSRLQTAMQQRTAALHIFLQFVIDNERARLHISLQQPFAEEHAMSSFKLLAMPDGNTKVAKGMKRGVMTFPMHLAPADLSGFEVCPMRSQGCTASCLNTAGRGRFDSTQAGRVRKTKWYFNDRASFLARLVKDIEAAIRYAAKRGYDVSIRLNATSDIPWHRIMVDGKSIIDTFPTVQFYDYTKVAKRLISETLPSNYHLTFSLAENNQAAAQAVLNAGGNVAVVFRDEATRDRYMASGFLGFTVINGDETDLRYLDPRNVVVGLYAKGDAKADVSGFVID